MDNEADTEADTVDNHLVEVDRLLADLEALHHKDVPMLVDILDKVSLARENELLHSDAEAVCLGKVENLEAGRPRARWVILVIVGADRPEGGRRLQQGYARLPQGGCKDCQVLQA